MKKGTTDPILSAVFGICDGIGPLQTEALEVNGIGLRTPTLARAEIIRCMRDKPVSHNRWQPHCLHMGVNGMQ